MSGRGMPMKTHKIQNKGAAEQQITAEQLIRDANQFREEQFKETDRKFVDAADVELYQSQQRQRFEQRVGTTARKNLGAWLEYASWEIRQKDLMRARSIFERALEGDFVNDARYPSIWQQYAAMEATHNNVNFARNIYDRVTRHLPRKDQFWLDWVLLEERVGAVDSARAVLHRWVHLIPSPGVSAWNTYVNFEVRHKNIPGARGVFEEYLLTHNTVETYLKYAEFEARHGDVDRARVVYARAHRELEGDANDPRLFLAHAQFEVAQGREAEARRVFKAGLEALPAPERADLFVHYAAFEKQHGDAHGIDDVVHVKRAMQLEEEVAKAPRNYDAWFDLARLKEAVALEAVEALDAERERRIAASAAAGVTAGDVARGMQAAAGGASTSYSSSSSSAMTDGEVVATSVDVATSVALMSSTERAQREAVHKKVRDVYERAVAQVPLVRDNKLYWRRYIYLWIMWAVYEELVAGSIANARAVYKRALELVPHASFTFSKLWINAAQVEVRAKDLGAARRLLGQALGRCPSEKLYRAYIEMEQDLGEVVRCRTLYEGFVPFATTNSEVWVSFAKFEADLSELTRARRIFELGVDQSPLDRPEVLWKAYIEFEVAQGEHGRARALYERLLQRTQHIKMWLAFAAFEATAPAAAALGEGAGAPMERARGVLQRADAHCKTQVKAAMQAATSSGPAGNPSAEAVAAAVSAKEERLVLLRQWVELERAAVARFTPAAAADASAAAAAAAAAESLKGVEAKLPQQVRRLRQGTTAGGVAVMQEYVDYVFPDDAAPVDRAQKLKDMVAQWKRQKAEGGAAAPAAGAAGAGTGEALPTGSAMKEE